jgi:hypothetical protein
MPRSGTTAVAWVPPDRVRGKLFKPGMTTYAPNTFASSNGVATSSWS